MYDYIIMLEVLPALKYDRRNPPSESATIVKLVDEVVGSIIGNSFNFPLCLDIFLLLIRHLQLDRFYSDSILQLFSHQIRKIAIDSSPRSVQQSASAESNSQGRLSLVHRESKLLISTTVVFMNAFRKTLTQNTPFIDGFVEQEMALFRSHLYPLRSYIQELPFPCRLIPTHVCTDNSHLDYIFMVSFKKGCL